jgi:mono/diheme cytochrome c family protein
MFIMRPIVLFLLIAAAAVAQPPRSAPAVNFQREVRPILSDNCFACHGPDKGTRLAGLRLDLKADALAARKTGAAIVPGNPAASQLYLRLVETNPAKRMPPSYSHKTLTKAQIETLRRWIAQGARWEEHWAFRAPVRPQPPLVRNAAWVRNPVDRFILARLEANSLKPAPEADRRTLARRAALDLTGLPPDPEDVEAFVNDKSPRAYEKYVDKLMASPHWGEHRARYWLDAARYADTHGIHVDNYREMWPYRDWVINAYNRNLPFDRFIIEQLAGDLLPNRTLDQQIASGFHRCNVTTNEAGVIVEEVEAIYAKDRVDTTGTVFLGLTVGCATCHDHKFDPISMRDFYSMAAFFRNTTQNAMDGNIPDTPPVIVVPNEEDRPRWEALKQEAAGLRDRMEKARAGADSTFDAWLASAERRALRTPLEPDAEAMRFAPEAMPATEGVTLRDSDIGGRKAAFFARETHLELPNVAAFDADKPFSLAVRFFFPTREEAFVIASQSDPKDKGRGWVIEIGARVPQMRLVGDGGRAITIRAGHMEQLKPGTWNSLVFTYDGGREQLGFNMYMNGRAIPTQGRGDQNTRLTGAINTGRPLVLGGEGSRFFADGAISDFRIFNREISEEEARLADLWPAIEAARAKDTLSEPERGALRLYYLTHKDAHYRTMASRLVSIEAERLEIRRRGAVTHVMQERTDQKPFAHVLARGMYDRPGEKVEPNVPAVLPPLKADYPKNRLGLAMWLTDAGHPLTARVAVNRMWQEVFGTGIVKTADDFGSQGTPPSHPELLDWLAVEFRDSGWDVKKFYKMLLTSAAYRQSAASTPDKLEKDPDNILLSRGPRFRLDGELVRDYALAASGLLVPSVGGPSVKPYQPEGIWETVAMVGSNTRHYKADDGDGLYRRSMYWFWKRSAPPASMEIFNAPTREVCTVRRERTNTPLQALVTMNDVQFVEAARNLAERALRMAPSLDARLDYMTARLIARPLDAKEREVARTAYRDYLSYYDAHPEDAEKLLRNGASRADSGFPRPEFAAMTMVANQLLNLDEVLTK